MEVTFLTQDQIFGNDRLGVIRAYGTKTGLSDLAVALGGALSSSEITAEGDRSGVVWSASSTALNYVFSVGCCGLEGYSIPSQRFVTARPALPSSVTSKINPSNAKTIRLPNGEEVKSCEYGEYPQKAVGEITAKRLELYFKAGFLHKSGKSYTFDNEKKLDSKLPFSSKTYEEYVSAGKKYIRVEGLPYNNYSKFANGRSLKEGKAYWFEVQPIEWLMDNSGVWVAKKALFAGMPFDDKANYDGNFSKTAIKSYLDKYFSAEMQPTRTAEHTVTKNEEKSAELTDMQKKQKDYLFRQFRQKGY